MATEREWLREQGHEIGDRGRIPADLHELWLEREISDQVDADLDADMGVTEADFTGLDEPVTVEAETQPTRPRRRSTTPRKRASGLLGRVLEDRSKTKTGSKKKVARVPLDKLVTRGYTRLGQVMQGISPPTGRCLQAQAAMAGIMLNDILKDTVADRLLQPVARATDKLDKGFALIAPPAIVFALDVMPPPMEDAGPAAEMKYAMRRGLMMAMLRESLIISLEVSADYADRVAENIARHSEAEAKVDELIRMIFEGVPVPEPEMAAA